MQGMRSGEVEYDVRRGEEMDHVRGEGERRLRGGVGEAAACQQENRAE
jgi:hypothetical protein